MSKSSKNNKWIIKIIIWTFFLSSTISITSELLLSDMKILLALFILIIIIFIGIVFDTIGIAVTAANEQPFHAMSSDRIKGAKEAVNLVKNADIVSNFCNDVIGDISGIVSGAAGATIVINLLSIYNGSIEIIIIPVIMTSFIATLTVGGKAIGKKIAITKYKKIIYNVAFLIFFVKKILNKNN